MSLNQQVSVDIFGQQFPAVIRPLTRADRRKLAELGVVIDGREMTPETAEAFGKYLIENCIIEGLSEDSPILLETRLVTLVMKLSNNGKLTDDDLKN